MKKVILSMLVIGIMSALANAEICTSVGATDKKYTPQGDCGLSWNASSQSCQCNSPFGYNGYNYIAYMSTVFIIPANQAGADAWLATNNPSGKICDNNWCKSGEDVGTTCVVIHNPIANKMTYSIFKCICGTKDSYEMNVGGVSPYGNSKAECEEKLAALKADWASRGILPESHSGVPLFTGAQIGTCSHPNGTYGFYAHYKIRVQSK